MAILLNGWILPLDVGASVKGLHAACVTALLYTGSLLVSPDLSKVETLSNL